MSVFVDFIDLIEVWGNKYTAVASDDCTSAPLEKTIMKDHSQEFL